MKIFNMPTSIWIGFGILAVTTSIQIFALYDSYRERQKVEEQKPEDQLIREYLANSSDAYGYPRDEAAMRVWARQNCKQDGICRRDDLSEWEEIQFERWLGRRGKANED